MSGKDSNENKLRKILKSKAVEVKPKGTRKDIQDKIDKKKKGKEK